MPSKYVVRDFTEGNVYHIYNKSLAPILLFQDDNDFQIFLYYLTIYTRPLEKVLEKYPNLPFRLRYNNISSEIDILAYSLLPTHFHIVARLHTKEGISRLMKQLTNAYTYYYNRRHKRSGPLLQGRFRACSLDVEKELKYLVRYLDRLPQEEGSTKDYLTYPYSSFQEYNKDLEDTLTKQRLIRSFLTSPQNYIEFIKDDNDYRKTQNTIKDIKIHT